MTKKIVGKVLEILRALFIALFKLIMMVIALICKITGMILSKTGETIEKLVTK
jgi:hypothetical protein